MSLKRNLIQVVGLVLTCFCGAIPGLSEPIAASVYFPEVGLVLSQPKGFEKASSFYGFQQEATGSSILLTLIPGPFSKVTQRFTPSEFKARGITMLSKAALRVKDQPGLLLNLDQRAYGETYQKWVLVFGDETQTRMVTATFPEAEAEGLGCYLKQIVLETSVREGREQSSSLPFMVKPALGLMSVAQARSLGQVLALSQDGEFHPESPNRPLLIIAPSLGAVPVIAPQSYALLRLKQTAETQVQNVESNVPVKIDGLSGYETVATGTDAGTGIPLKIYQVMLFPKNGGYILMTGLVGTDLASVYIPKFRATVKTYRSQERLNPAR